MVILFIHLVVCSFVCLLIYFYFSIKNFNKKRTVTRYYIFLYACGSISKNLPRSQLDRNINFELYLFL